MLTGPALVVVGEALIDLVPVAGNDHFQARPGGSPFNVAIGLARLGNHTALMARLADNAFGRLLRDHAAAEGIDLSSAPLAVEPTTLAVVSLDHQAQPSYDFYFEGTADWQWTAAEMAQLPRDAAVLHFGSLASWTEPGCAALYELAARTHAAGHILVSYDPNVRPLVLGEPARGRDLVERSVGVAHLVKASTEDIEWLYPGVGSAEVGARWTQLGVDVVVITDGPHGAVAYRADRDPVGCPGRAVEVADTVGAGDAFTAGLLSALAQRGLQTPTRLAQLSVTELSECLSEAVLVASLTCEKAGADPPRANRRSGTAPLTAADFAS